MSPAEIHNKTLEQDSREKKIDVKSEYTLGRVLGKGAFAKVHIGRLIKNSKVERAVTLGVRQPLDESCAQGQRGSGTAGMIGTGEPNV